MKSLIQVAVVTAVLTTSAASFAQSNAPVTRAQVRAELVQLEKAGYRPGDGDHTRYPAQIEAAEARVIAQNDATSGVGGVVSGSSAAGAGASVLPPVNGGVKSLYFGH